MADPLSNESAKWLQSLVSRIERLEEDRRELGSDIKEIFKEAKSAGYALPALKALIRERRKSPEAISILKETLDSYRCALEGIADLPLGKHAIERAAARMVA
jgi:uncharacterized protein (UPF0335 family)